MVLPDTNSSRWQMVLPTCGRTEFRHKDRSSVGSFNNRDGFDESRQ